jgi:hypothetical protein
MGSLAPIPIAGLSPVPGLWPSSRKRNSLSIFWKFTARYKIKKIIPNKSSEKTKTINLIRTKLVLLKPIDSKLTKLYAAIPMIEIINHEKAGFDALIVLRSKF